MKEWQHLWDKPVLDEIDLHKREWVAYLSREIYMQWGNIWSRLLEMYYEMLCKPHLSRIVLMRWRVSVYSICRTTISILPRPTNIILFRPPLNHCVCLFVHMNACSLAVNHTCQNHITHDSNPTYGRHDWRLRQSSNTTLQIITKIQLLPSERINTYESQGKTLKKS